MPYVAGWLLLCGELQPATDTFMRWLSGATGMAATSHLYSAVSFFAFEVPKVLMLLALIAFVVGVIQTFFTLCAAGFHAHLMGKGAWWSVPLAVLIGVPMYSNAAGCSLRPPGRWSAPSA